MEFKNISFPIKSCLTIRTLSFEEYLKDIMPNTILFRRDLEQVQELTDHNCTESEKILLKKSARLCSHFYSPVIINDWGLLCKFCHSKIIEPPFEFKQRRVAQPRFCPKCNSSVRDVRCLYCDKDISKSYVGGVFCEECLNFVDEIQFKKEYKQKKKEIIKKGYTEPAITSKVCLEKYCNELPDESSNKWFCGKHWEEYKVFRDKKFPFKNFSKEDRDRIEADYYEQVNPKWVWVKHLGPALKYAENGNYKRGQEIIAELLKNKDLLPEYSLNCAYDIIGDLCFFNKEFDRAISYYKYDIKQGDNNYNMVGDINKVLNARRLAGENMAGDEIISVSQSSFYVDQAVDQSDPLGGYSQMYKPTNFFNRNMELVGRFAEELTLKWEGENNKKLLNMGGKDLDTYFDFPWIKNIILFEDSNLFGHESTKEQSYDGDELIGFPESYTWYSKLFKKFGVLNYEFSNEKRFKIFIETIVDIVYKAEDLARQYMGISKRGEGWVSETELYYKIKGLFSKYEVLHQARPNWLSPLHLDIYIPDLNLAIEYQGLQHVRPIEFFGGEKGYSEIIKRDKKKKELCETNNIDLIYIFENEKNEEINDKLKGLVDIYLK